MTHTHTHTHTQSSLNTCAAADRKVRGDFPAGVPGEHMYAVYVQQTLRPRMPVRLRADSTKRGTFLGSTRGASGALLAEVMWAGAAARDRVDWVDLEVDVSG
jgi:hypothetical protein